MATYLPNPASLMTINKDIIGQPAAVDFTGNLTYYGTSTGYADLNNIPPNNMLMTYREASLLPLNEEHTLYESPNSTCKVTIQFRGVQSNQLIFDLFVYKSGTRVYSGVHTISISAQPDFDNYYIGILFFETENRYLIVKADYEVNRTRGRGQSGYFSASTITQLLTDSAVPDDPYAFSPESGEDGGYGDFDYSSDDTDFSRLPSLSACDVGFCKLYEMGPSDVKSLASYLWGLGSIASFLPIFSDPMDCILSLGIVPVSPTTGANEVITVGNLTTTVSGTKITKQFDKLDCGSISLNGKQFSKSFMDYSPYTKAELFLPYIGTVSLDIDEIMDASALHLQYQFDLLSGACIAELKVTKTYNYQNGDHVHENVLYRYSGNILTNIPITGANYTQMYQAIVSAVATGIGGAAGAETAKTAAAAENIQNQAALSNVANSTGMKPGIRRAGNASANCGYLGGQIPELILSLPKLAHLGKAQGHEVGYPRYGEYTLSVLSGYTQIMQAHLKAIKCTDAERDQIQTVLNAGCILSKTAVPTQSAAANTIKIYSYSCEKICLNKADNWELIDTITGSWRSADVDILKPVIRIEATNALTLAKILKQANYVYLSDTDRYYYVTGMSAGSGNIITLSLEVDACMSWLADLKNEKVVIDRQEKSWNTYLNDGFIRTYNTPYTVVKQFPVGFFSEHFILAVAGG